MTTVAAANGPMAIAQTGERFYVRMAAICLAVAVVGFAPTYWIPMARGTLRVAPLTHVHAALFYGWLVLFLGQTALAASGRLVRHQTLGVAGVAVATAMCLVGIGTAMNSVRVQDAAGFGDAARRFSIVPLTGAAAFALLFGLALLNLRNTEIHKRLMVVATVSLLQAAVGRWFLILLAPRPQGAAGALGPPPVAVTIMPALVIDLLIVAAMIHDKRTTGRVHPAYWIAGGAVLAVQVLRVPLSATGAWMAVANWILAFAP